MIKWIIIAGNEVRTKWNSLRTQYGKALNTPKSGSKATTLTPRQKWILRTFGFLKQYTKMRKTKSNLGADPEDATVGDTSENSNASEVSY